MHSPGPWKTQNGKVVLIGFKKLGESWTNIQDENERPENLRPSKYIFTGKWSYSFFEVYGYWSLWVFPLLARLSELLGMIQYAPRDDRIHGPVTSFG